ncbi:MAG: TrmH family RNA methyltransferase [Bacillota bacterium]
MRELSSSENQVVKQTARLLVNGAYRKQKGLAVLEGFKLVGDAVGAGAQVAWIIFSQDAYESPSARDLVSNADPRKVFVVPDRIVKKLSSAVTPQGVVAVVAAPRTELLDCRDELTRLVALDGVQDPGNCGTLIRGAAAFGFGVVVLPGTVDPYSPKVLRASMGGLYRTPVYWCYSAQDLLDFADRRGLTVWMAHNKGGIPVDQAEIEDHVVLVLGSEGQGHVGLSPELHSEIKRIWVPMERHVESLNVAMAGTILMYECYRRRKAWRC